MRSTNEATVAPDPMPQTAPGQEGRDRDPAQPQPPCAEVCGLQQWLADPHLSIPHYQRPYKWGLPQVQQLLTDIEQQTLATSREQGARSYRMGTVVVHVEQVAATAPGSAVRTVHNIVDGQQRTVTLLLVLHALRNLVAGPEGAALACSDAVPAWQQGLRQLSLFEPQFSSAQSQQQVQTNYQAIVRHVRQAQWGREQAVFLLERCQVVRVKLHNLTEAFQFFDAQNGRGKALCVHDLLKAFHLRALRPAQWAQRAAAVQTWEQCTQADLERLFARFLFQVRQRGRGQNAEFFGRRHVGVFKGISLDADAAAPMARAWRMLDGAVDWMEGHAGKPGALLWPSQLDAPVINGLRFFHWVQHYWGMGFHVRQKQGQLPPWAERLQQPLKGDAHAILRDLGVYPGHDRRGDSHVRAVFDALLMYYLDKFGEHGLEQAVKLAFVWAYSRLLHRRVLVGSMDKFVAEGPVNPFAVLRDAVTPQDFLHISLPPACYQHGRPPSQGLEVLQQWMQKLGYWQTAAHGGTDDARQ